MRHISATIRNRIFTTGDLYEQVKVGEDRGRYRARVRIGHDPASGKYVYKTIMGASEIEVREKVFTFIRQQIEGQAERAIHDALLETDIEEWLHSKYGTIKAVSYDRLEQTYTQIKPYISGLRTADVAARDCRRILDANLSAGYAYSSLLKIYRLLHEFFEAQRKAGEIDRNPIDGVKMYSRDFVLSRQAEVREAREEALEKAKSGTTLTPAESALAASRLRMADKTSIRILTDEEIARILDVAVIGYVLRWESKKGNPIETAPQKLVQAKYFLFALNTGLREGELIGLKYSDVDFEAHTVTVQRNRTRYKRRDVAGHAIGGYTAKDGSPKTKRSLATIPVSDAALQILRDMQSDEPEGYDGYIANNGGQPMTESGFRRRFVSLLDRAGVEQCGLHSLRHTFASKLFDLKGGNAKLVSELVRHSSVAFTESVYIHLIEQSKANVVSDFKI